MTILVAMNLVLLPGFQQVLPVQAAGLVLLLLLGSWNLPRRYQHDVAPRIQLVPGAAMALVHSGHDVAQAGVAVAGVWLASRLSASPSPSGRGARRRRPERLGPRATYRLA